MTPREKARASAPVGIGVPRRILKARKDRNEAAVKKDVRAECVERDGYCVINRFMASASDRSDVLVGIQRVLECSGPSQWTHMHARRRSQTRNQAPEIRHSTRFSFMACQRHHDQYDGRERPRLFVTALSHKGADGPLKFRMGKS